MVRKRGMEDGNALLLGHHSASFKDGHGSADDNSQTDSAKSHTIGFHDIERLEERFGSLSV
jgi:hypothetical protein